jgi:hypothetical protein
MRTFAFVFGTCFAFMAVAGCAGDIDIELEDIVARLTDAAGPIQTRPQELPPVLVQQGDTINIDASVNIIAEPERDIIVVELPNRTVLGFENDTGWDIYVTYYADGQFQGVYVYDREALLLDYPCLSVIELLSEDDVDPNTGVLVDTFDLSGVAFFNPDDFFCGDAFILNFDPNSVTAHAEVVDLAP